CRRNARRAAARLGAAALRGRPVDELSRDASAARSAAGASQPPAGDPRLPVVARQLRGPAARAGLVSGWHGDRQGIHRPVAAQDDTARHLPRGLAGESAMTTEEYAASLESSVELLRTIAAVLDIRSVFPQVSEIANKVVAHDLLTMMFHDRGGQILIEAASTDEFAGLSRFTKADDSQPDEGFIIIDDFTTATLPIVDPIDLRERIVAAGFRSLLVVMTRARHQDMGLGFWSKRPRAFSRDHVPAARRIADHVALAVSHEQLAEAARQVAEAQARAERLEARVQSLTEELHSRSEHARVIGRSAEWKQILKQATQVAETETTVLLTGESGTGKEVVARFIHRGSPRKSGPFVALNCAALPEQLLESELFG